MFNQTFTDRPSRRPSALGASRWILAYGIELAAVGVLLVYPLISTNALPKTQRVNFLAAPAPPAAPPAATPTSPPAHRVSLMELLRAPTVIPRSIKQIKEQPEPPSYNGFSAAVPGAVPHGAPWSEAVIGPIKTPPPPPPPHEPIPAPRIRVGGSVEAARAIYRPMPAYPALARIARVEGLVRLEAVIGKDGAIENLRVVSGHPLLIAAALNAVKQWRYEPTLLDGAPVEVVTEIDVNFTLSEN
ncbi:MAG: energy transducer TonB [Terriglobia bacterium]